MEVIKSIAFLILGAALCEARPEPELPLHASKASIIKPPQDALPPVYNATLHGPQESNQQFKYYYVAQDGAIYDVKWQTYLIEVAATLGVSNYGHYIAASIIGRQVKHSPPQVFQAFIEQGATVGIFTFADKTTIFPEYAHLRNRPECGSSCAGSCADTCSADGRKYDDIAGLGGIRATCIVDNVLCTSSDPYRSQCSILVHEFAHTLHYYGIRPSSDYYNRIYNAWATARARGTWDVNSYAMTNDLEYFAEASGTFYNVNKLPGSSGGMSSCGSGSNFVFCSSEAQARQWLASRDPALYDALVFTYTNYGYQPGELTICP